MVSKGYAVELMMGVGSGRKSRRFDGAAWRGVKAPAVQIDGADEQVAEPDLHGQFVTQAQTDMPAGEHRAEVDEIICWLTGYTSKQLEKLLKQQTDFESFFTKAPKKNPKRKLITGLICGVRVEDIEDPMMRELRYLDKLVDELAKGKALEKILRT